MPRVDGVDLSHFQDGALNFAKFKAAGGKFVIHKATESLSFVDPNYANRRGQVAKAGLRFGAYHFARPSSSTGTAQAKAFLAAAQPHKGDLRPVLDLEDRGGLSIHDLTEWVQDFNAEVKRQVGDAIILYTPFPLGDVVASLPLWVARYSDSNLAPNLPHPFAKYTIWQFSDGKFGTPNAAVGIGHCDLDTLHDGVEVHTLCIGYEAQKAAKAARRAKRRARVQRVRERLAAARTARARAHDVLVAARATVAAVKKRLAKVRGE